MSGEEEELFKALLEFAAELEEAAKKLRENLAKLTPAWEEIRSGKPLDPEDKAVLWLERRLEQIKQKHPEVQSEFIKDSEGRILGLRFSASNDEVADDIRAPANWAFSKAATRPQT